MLRGRTQRINHAGHQCYYRSSSSPEFPIHICGGIALHASVLKYAQIDAKGFGKG
jgi:hypothetical protein